MTHCPDPRRTRRNQNGATNGAAPVASRRVGPLCPPQACDSGAPRELHLTGRTIRFNLAQGFVGTASGLGASLSTTVSGLIAGTFGLTASFAALTAIGLVALLVGWGLARDEDERLAVWVHRVG